MAAMKSLSMIPLISAVLFSQPVGVRTKYDLTKNELLLVRRVLWNQLCGEFRGAGRPWGSLPELSTLFFNHRELELERIVDNPQADKYDRFTAAEALASFGNKHGSTYLHAVLESGICVTQSGFELSDAGLALLAIGDPLPNFQFSKVPNPKYREFDTLAIPVK